MNEPHGQVLVVGAGVSGLTTAVVLAEAGHEVKIWTAEAPEKTTSVAAGAMWGPYLVEPVDRVRHWSARSLTAFRELAQHPESGVRLGSGVEASRVPVAPPTWGSELEGFRMCEPSELPEGFATGWRFTVPLIDMPTYLGYLQRRLVAAGGVIEQRRLASLDEATAVAPVVVNCAGMGSKDLVPDPSLYPVRGQLVVVANPGIEKFFSEDTGLSPDLLHYCPHGGTVVLGGQAAADDVRTAADLDLAKAIVARCAAIEPRLADATILEHRVGFRPTRPAVRVEAEQRGDAVIVHNYGHGGAGVTLSWGCATEANDKVAKYQRGATSGRSLLSEGSPD